MAENENVQNPEAQQPQAQPEQDDQPVFQLQRCYLKDASLEMPHAPDILLTPQESAPQDRAPRSSPPGDEPAERLHGSSDPPDWHEDRDKPSTGRAH